jgi:hypothetical protein
MVARPAVMPDTTPLILPTVATDVLLLNHVPPLVAELNVVVAPEHIASVPVIAAGEATTVTTAVTKQPLDKTWEIVAVPVVTPETTPDMDTVAITELLLVQVPLPDELNVVVETSHRVVVPVIADGVANTVAAAVLTQPPKE